MNTCSQIFSIRKTINLLNEFIVFIVDLMENINMNKMFLRLHELHGIIRKVSELSEHFEIPQNMHVT